MLKMLLDPMGGIVLTNDGNAILREIEVTHPAAKSMIEISRAQDEEVGDGTKSVVILAGEFLQAAELFIEKDIHPTVIVNAYFQGLEKALKIVNEMSIDVKADDDKEIEKILKSTVATKFVSKWGDFVCKMAIQAVRKVATLKNGHQEIDTKRYAKVEKIPGGTIEECTVLDGVMVNKDLTHPQMRKRIENPRIILLDCPLEYKKGESQTNMELTKEEDFKKALQNEEDEVRKVCNAILAFKPDVVITEKGVSDLAQHFFLKKNVTVLRRLRKTDNNRIARVSGATIVNRPEELQESDVGTNCGLYELRKIGDEFFSYFVKCKDAKACTILLRGATKDVLNEIERNLQDAISVARNIILNPRLVPGGGALEMELSCRLMDYATKEIKGTMQWPFKALASAFEVIPRTLAQNSGTDVVKRLTELREKHSTSAGAFIGIDGNDGKLVDMKVANIYDPTAVKIQTIKTAIEVSVMLLRIDDIVSGIKKEKKEKSKSQMQGAENPEGETVLIYCINLYIVRRCQRWIIKIIHIILNSTN
jgi:T-complex protein 1 subunit gamma